MSNYLEMTDFTTLQNNSFLNKVEQVIEPFILSLCSPTQKALLAKQQNLLRKMTREERSKTPRLKKDEKQELQRISNIAKYIKGMATGEHSISTLELLLPVAISVPNGSTIDIVNDAAEWLKNAGRLMQPENPNPFCIVGIGFPQLLRSRLNQPISKQQRFSNATTKGND